MTWVRCFLITFIFFALAVPAAVGKIRHFTDSQGILHISNTEPDRQDLEEERAGPAAPPILPRNSQRPPLPPGIQPPPPAPEPPAESGPPPAPPAPGKLKAGDTLGQREDVGKGVHPLARVDHRVMEPISAPAESREPQGYTSSPYQNRETVVHYQDHDGVIHISNPVTKEVRVPSQVAGADPPAGPKTITTEGSGPLLPWERASWSATIPSLPAWPGAEVNAPPPALEKGTIYRFRDAKGVIHISNCLSQDEEPSAMALMENLKEKIGDLATRFFGGIRPQTLPTGMSGGGLPATGTGGQQIRVRQDFQGRYHISNQGGAALAGLTGGLPRLGQVNPALEPLIVEAAVTYRLPVSLVLALIRMESNFTPGAVSAKGAMGLMQLMPGTASLLGVQDPFCPRENLMAGCRYLRFLLDHFQGSVPLALAAYNAGHQRVVAAGYQIPPFRETQEFVTQVMGLYYVLEKSAHRF